MKLRIVIVLLVAVLAPIAALAWLGTRLANDESEMVRHRFDELVRGELAGVESSLGRVLERWQRDLARATDVTDVDPAALRDRARSERAVRQLFVLGADRKMLFPPPEGDRTDEEEAFLVRTRALWDAGEGFVRPADGGAPGAGTGDQGWYSWYWGAGLHLLWWKHDAAGRVVGAEVDRSALMADLVGELPSTDDGDPAAFRGRIRLVDGNGATLYGWGARDPGDGEAPRVVRELGAPLASWRLEYFPADGALDAAFGRTARLALLAGLAALALVVAGLAAYVLREGGREVRDAQQRVSFVNQVSHELKTPLTSIRMYAELLDDRLEDDDEVSRRHVKVIVSESRRLSRLIANVLSFARQGRGKLSVHPAPARVDDVVADVVAQFRPQLAARGVDIDYHPGAGPDEVLLDADALGQVLGNLLGNVEKYAADTGRVDLTTRRDGDRTTIEVADRGPGIPAWARRRVFEPFYRVSARVADGVAGTGIGLSISRELARRHGGDLTLEPADAGARFRLVLRTPTEVRS